jgi:hypothetical protein
VGVRVVVLEESPILVDMVDELMRRWPFLLEGVLGPMFWIREVGWLVSVVEKEGSFAR